MICGTHALVSVERENWNLESEKWRVCWSKPLKSIFKKLAKSN